MTPSYVNTGKLLQLFAGRRRSLVTSAQDAKAVVFRSRVLMKRRNEDRRWPSHLWHCSRTCSVLKGADTCCKGGRITVSM